MQLLLAEIPVHVDARCDYLDADLDELYGHAKSHVASGGDTSPIHIRIGAGGCEPVPHTPPTFRLTSDRMIHGWLQGDELLMSDGRCSARVEYSSGRAHLLVPKDPHACFVAAHRLFPIALGELLRMQGVFYVHGAAFEWKGRALLGVADSGVGKSTLTYRAMAAGARYIADDGVLFRVDAQGARCFPLYRDFALDPALLTDADRPRAALSAPTVDGPRWCLKPHPRQCQSAASIGAVCQLTRLQDNPSRFDPTPAAPVVRELVKQNVFVALYPPLAKPHLSALASLTNHARTGILRLNHDLIESQEAVEHLLEATLQP